MLIARNRVEKEELFTNFSRLSMSENESRSTGSKSTGEKECPTAEGDTGEDSSASTFLDRPDHDAKPVRRPSVVEIFSKELSSDSVDPELKSLRQRSIAPEDACTAKPILSSSGVLIKSGDGRYGSLSRQCRKRKRLDEIDASHHQALRDVETLKTSLMKSLTSSRSGIDLIEQLEAENQRLRTDLKTSKQQMTSLSEFQTKIDQLASERDSLRKNYDEALAKAKQQTNRNTKVSKEKSILEASVESLKSTNRDLTAQLDNARSTLTAERDELCETLTAAKTEKDALKGLAEMFISGVNIKEFLKQVKAGTQFDEALRASMRNRGQA